MGIIDSIWQCIDGLDKQLFLLLNANHSPFWDSFMFWMSHKWIWLPLYFCFVFLIFYALQRFDYKLVIVIAMLIASTDMCCSLLLKPSFKRLRPCHQSELKTQIHTVGNCGGQYGFASSHAGNTFAIATFLYLWFRKNNRVKLLFVWAFVVSFSRIYLGVHFPLDVVVGALIGIIFATIAYKYCPKSLKT